MSPKRSSSRGGLAEYRRKRDFSVTPEPSGDAASQSRAAPQARRAPSAPLRFVIQKHAASHLHFDFRLELGGVMKSWAVPKGPSLDPSAKRLAMEVEDHPIEYNTFEGTIPAGEYGGGTVMLWDRGTYAAATYSGAGDEDALRRGYEKGEMKFALHGERLRGSFALVRMKRPGRPQWLLIKHRDAEARPNAAEEGTDITDEFQTSVT